VAYCTRCGARSQGSRYCTACGEPAHPGPSDRDAPTVVREPAWWTDEASPTAVRTQKAAPPSSAAADSWTTRTESATWEPPPATGLPSAADSEHPHHSTAISEPPRRQLRAGLVLTLVAAVALALAGGTFAYQRLRSDPTTETAGGGSESPAHPTDPAQSLPTDGDEESQPTSPKVSTTPTTREPATPDDAAQLDEATARVLLDERVSNGRSGVAALANSWSPQISSKCEGLGVDIGPAWWPDGQVDTPSVTEAQILAFHLALEQRFEAVTTTAQELSVDRTASSCAGLPIWVSLAPLPFTTAGEANSWCDAQGLPVDECGARYVVPQGTSGTRFVPR
jgi:hypothetical protein